MILSIRVLDYIKANPQHTSVEIADSLGVSYRQVNNTISFLHRKGLILKVKIPSERYPNIGAWSFVARNLDESTK